MILVQNHQQPSNGNKNWRRSTIYSPNEMMNDELGVGE